MAGPRGGVPPAGGRTMHGYWLGAAVAGGLSAALYLSVLAAPGGVMLASFTMTPLFVIGLSFGLPAALAAGLVAMGAVLAAIGLVGGLLYGAVNALPVMVLVGRALLSRVAQGGGLEWYPPGLLVSWLTAIALAALALLLAMLGAGPGDIGSGVQEQVEQMLPLFGAEAEAIRPVLEGVAPIFPGLAAAAWMTVTALNGALSQGLLVRTGRARRPSPDISATELPRWIPAALGITVLLALLGSGTPKLIAANAVAVLAVAYLILGLAVVHAASRGMRGRPALLGFLYAIMAVLAWPMLVIAALGLIDQLAGLKRRIAASGREV